MNVLAIKKNPLNWFQNEDCAGVDAVLTSPSADQQQIGPFPVENEGKGQPIRCSTRVVKKVVKQEPATIPVSSFDIGS